MRLFAFLLTPLFAALPAVPAGADHCRVVRQRVVVQHHAAVVAVKAAVVTPIAVAAFAPVAVQVPAYSVGYDPHGGEVAELKQSVRELTQALQALRQNQAAPAPADNLQAKAVQLLSAKCAQCHTGNAPSGKLSIFGEPGQLSASLNTLDVVEMVAQAKDGRMPKPPNAALTDSEFLLLEEWKKEQVKAARASIKQQSQK